MSGRHIAFPFLIGTDGRSATPLSLDDHIRGEIIQLLLTNPGERAFIPSFGGGLRRLVFERNDEVTAGLTKATVTQALNRWLGHRIKVEHLEVTHEESKLTVDLRYRIIATNEEKHMRFERAK